MTSKILLPALLVLVASMGFSTAFATVEPTKLFAPVETTMLSEALTQLSLENERLVDFESNDQLRVLALDDKIVILNQDDKLVAVLGNSAELTKIVPRDVPIVDMPALQVKAIAVDDQELVVLKVDNKITVLSIDEIVSAVTPRMVELSVNAVVPFWEKTSNVLDITDVVKTEQGVIALDAVKKLHIFSSTQTLQYSQDSITSDLKAIVADVAAITAVADHIVIADNVEKQLVLVPTRDLIVQNLESAIVIPTTQNIVEIAAVADERADTVKIVALDTTTGLAQKIVVDLTHVEQPVRSIEQLRLMPTLATEVEVPITDIAIQKGNLLTIADDRLSTYDSLELRFFEPTNVVISKASIVRSDMLLAQTCSANVVDLQEYGVLTAGTTATATYQILTTGTPVVSMSASEWTSEGEVVIPASATSAALIADEVNFSETQMKALISEDVLTLGQVADGNSELKLKFSVPSDLTVEGEIQQQLALYAEC